MANKKPKKNPKKKRSKKPRRPLTQAEKEAEERLHVLQPMRRRFGRRQLAELQELVQRALDEADFEPQERDTVKAGVADVFALAWTAWQAARRGPEGRRHAPPKCRTCRASEGSGGPPYSALEVVIPQGLPGSGESPRLRREMGIRGESRRC